jgi:Spy/CpxP family protein refolding chaperone
MDVFTQKKLLIRVVVLLSIFNLLFIAFFVWKEISRPKRGDARPPEGKKEVSEILKKELNLNETQAEQIKQLRLGFFEKETTLSNAIKNERDSMNQLMYNKVTDDSLVLSLARKIAENEFEMERLKLEQSKQLKTICTPEQLEKFGKLVKEIRDYFKPEKKERNNK